MIQTESAQMVLIKILLIQIVLPAVVTLGISEFMRKKDWIKTGDMKLEFLRNYLYLHFRCKRL